SEAGSTSASGPGWPVTNCRSPSRNWWPRSRTWPSTETSAGFPSTPPTRAPRTSRSTPGCARRPERASASPLSGFGVVLPTEALAQLLERAFGVQVLLGHDSGHDLALGVVTVEANGFGLDQR